MGRTVASYAWEELGVPAPRILDGCAFLRRRDVHDDHVPCTKSIKRL